MKLRNLTFASLIVAGAAVAETMPTIGPGCAVQSIDRLATFDGLNYLNNGTALGDYTEGNLFIGTSGDSLAGWGPSVNPHFNPFHTALDYATAGFYFPDGGSNEWTVIKTTDSKKIYGLEFLYGNGWTTGDIYGVPWGNSSAWVDYEGYRNGVKVSSGQVGVNPMISVGTVIGFVDADGLSQLRLRCRIGNQADPSLQALAMDDLLVQLSATKVSGTVTLGDWELSPVGQDVWVDLIQDGVVVESQPLVLDSAGRFSVGTTKVGLTTFRVTGSHWLARKLGTYNLDSSPIVGAAALLINGDIDGDNSITVFDYGVLSDYFDKSAADADWYDYGSNGFAPYYADLDGDNAVTVFDYGILSGNFDQTGD